MTHFLSRSWTAGFIILIIIIECALGGCAAKPMYNRDLAAKEDESISNTRATRAYEMAQQKQKQNSRWHNRRTHAGSTTDAGSSDMLKNSDSRPILPKKSSPPVRAIYVSSTVVNSKKINGLIDLVDQTELNAMVIDINSGITLLSPSCRNKNCSSFKLSTKRSAQHFHQVIQRLKQHHIYLIARIVTFKDAALAKSVPAWAMKRKNGQVWRDRGGALWIDPYRQEAWEYPLALADYAAGIGFDEVQYDYVRFPENASKVDREVGYANQQGWSKSEAIRRFLHQANIRAHQCGVRISADVFGLVSSTNHDMGIGQRWDSIVKEIDVISPMVYPSHYSKGLWGIKNPDLSPGAVITHALHDAAERNGRLNRQGIVTAGVRPWLQGFTASWIHPHQKYGAAQIRQQIQAAQKTGFFSYMLWNSSNHYFKWND